MANKHDQPSSEQETLNIPDFLFNARPYTPLDPPEDEVDAVMESVMRAAGLMPSQEEEPAKEPAQAQGTHAPAVGAIDQQESASTEDEQLGETPASSAESDAARVVSVADKNDNVADTDASNQAEPISEPASEPYAEQTFKTAPKFVFDPNSVPMIEIEPDAKLTATSKDTPEPEPEPEPTPEPEPEPEPEAAAEPEPTVEEDLATLVRVERRLYAHRYAAAELETFGETIDPPKVTADRAEVMSVLVEEDHELLSDPAVGSMLERLTKHADELEPVVAKQVSVLARDRRRLVSASAEDQARLVRLQAESYDAWLAAKATDDWRSFAPYLDKLVSLQRKIALSIDPDADPYDTMLDEYETGATRSFYDNFFARIKRCVVPLLSSVSMSKRVLLADCVAGRFDEGRQWELARDVARLEGIDEEAHYLTSTEHPFSNAMTSNYAVTAAHVDPNNLMSNIYTMLHEVGHNLYEQGVDKRFDRISLKGGTSMGIHESQSRFFENYVGRDRAFMRPLLNLMKARFPGQLGRVTPNQLYRAVNVVSPSLIRVDADELTYPLHILVRYEIEQLLVDGKATAREVPALWDERYRNYLGVSVPNDTMGALQDVHWAWGSFGYFPAYALGNAYAAQLRAKMIEEGMDWDGLLAAGDLAPIRAWLRERVWRFGRSKDPAQIIEDACGEPFNPRHYANYLTHKYAALYGLK